MGLFDWMTGTKRPNEDVLPCSREDVANALLGLNGPDRPFTVRDGSDEGVDLIAEWKIADSRWYGYFGNVAKINRTMMRLDSERCEVRSRDQEWTVTWIGGQPQLTIAKSYSQGQVNKKSYSATFSRDENGKLVKESSRSFSTSELKPPMQGAVASLGWTWRGVILGKL